jgi:hypothetical protein
MNPESAELSQLGPFRAHGKPPLTRVLLRRADSAICALSMLATLRPSTSRPPGCPLQSPPVRSSHGTAFGKRPGVTGADWTGHRSITRNEGVPGSSPGVGSGDLQGFRLRGTEDVSIGANTRRTRTRVSVSKVSAASAWIAGRKDGKGNMSEIPITAAASLGMDVPPGLVRDSAVHIDIRESSPTPARGRGVQVAETAEMQAISGTERRRSRT